MFAQREVLCDADYLEEREYFEVDRIFNQNQLLSKITEAFTFETLYIYSTYPQGKNTCK